MLIERESTPSEKAKEYTLTEKQSLVFMTDANEVFAGGAASGGKTFVNKMLAITVAEQVPGAQIAILRNTSKNLKKNYFQGNESIPSILYEKIKEKKVVVNYTDMIVTWVETGSVIHFMHAEHIETTIENLQGLELVLVIIDEASLIHKKIINHSKTRLRVGSLKIESDFWKARLPRLQLTSNPGGISHNYLKQRYINPSPPGTAFIDEFGKKLLFVPFGARENPHIDYEAYERELRSTDDPVKYAQLAEGDWDAGGATFFGDAFKRTKNVIPDFVVPEDWRIYRTYDQGYSSPFGFVILVRVKGQNTIKMADGTTRTFPNDSVIVYREWYGYNGKDMNVGLRWVHEDIADMMKIKEEEWGLAGRVRPGRADWKLWEGETKLHDTVYSKRGIRFVKADKAKGSRVAGALKMRKLMFAAHDEYLEKPALFFVDKCVHCIATIPELPTDPDNPDDVVTEGVPDHLYDAIRYEVASPTRQAFYGKVTGL